MSSTTRLYTAYLAPGGARPTAVGRVLGALGAWMAHATNRQLSIATGLSRATVSQALSRMAEHGVVRKVRNGLWELRPASEWKETKE